MPEHDETQVLMADEPRERPRWPMYAALALLAIVLLLAGLESYHLVKPLPQGIPFTGELYPAEDVRFLSDVTFTDSSGRRRVRQEIFDEAFSIIRRAQRLIVLDMFLYNDFQGRNPEKTRPLSSEMTETLLGKMRSNPRMRIVLITDPINTVYGGLRSAQFDKLREAGVEVVETGLRELRDPNPAYSALWRPLFGFIKNTNDAGWLRNPFGQGEVTVRSWLAMLNFKANHRKTILADDPSAPGGWVGLVTSGNPHDASSAHGNIAVRFTGRAVRDLYRSELAVLAYSGGREISIEVEPLVSEARLKTAVLTESAIKDALLEGIYKAAGKGNRLAVGVFYLSDRDVVWALKEVSGTGADVRVLLDPNFDAFGHEKNGIPNRPVASELVRYGVPLRWCDTHGEQCHAKMLLADYADRTSRLLAGSANFTRRNLQDLNLETDVLVEGPSDEPVFRDARWYFDLLWSNRPGETYSVPYERYAEDSMAKDYLYRFMEFSGMSTF